MDKTTARLYDVLLTEMAKHPRSAWVFNHFNRLAIKISATTWQTFIQTATADGYIAPIRHSEVPHHNFGVYSITPQGVKFIVHQGGYIKKRRFENYTHTNIKFTWVRHWVWFYTAILSLLGNLFFIAKYLLQWL